MLKPPPPVITGSPWSSVSTLSSVARPSPNAPTLPSNSGTTTLQNVKWSRLNCLADCFGWTCLGADSHTKPEPSTPDVTQSDTRQWESTSKSSSRLSYTKIRQLLFGNHSARTQPTNTQELKVLQQQTMVPSGDEQPMFNQFCAKCSQVNLQGLTSRCNSATAGGANPADPDSVSLLLIDVVDPTCHNPRQQRSTPTSTVTLSPESISRQTIRTISDGRCLSLSAEPTQGPASPTSPIRAEPQSAPCLESRMTPSSLFSSRTSSPSNYCRVATCQQLHIHDLTPKCLETFAPSSTCSSCQTCDRPHIGPNHDQVMLVGRLCKELPIINPHKNPHNAHHIIDLGSSGSTKTSSLLLQWPLPEYRPQHSPDHLYRSFGY